MATGDVGFFDRKGHIYVRGRKEELITAYNQTFSAMDVEDIILQHACVLECVVIGTKDAIIACVVLSDDCIKFTDHSLLK